MANALSGLIRIIDAINDAVGRGVAWLIVAMVVNVFVVVVLRYLFATGWIWMQETYVWMHGIVFMLGAAYTLLHDGHVRIDIVYRRYGERFRAWIDLLGALLLGLPVVWITARHAVPYFGRSFARLESSPEVGGLPALYLLKGVILVFCMLFALQLIALALRSLLVIAGGTVPPRRSETGTTPT